MPRSRKAPLVARDAPPPAPPMLKSLTVSGFKSHRDPHAVEFRALTILAGANSSGKSSLIQPLLLLKQTLEAGYDPGVLMLDGPHEAFSSPEQFLWRSPGEKSQGLLLIDVALTNGRVVQLRFVMKEGQIAIEEQRYKEEGGSFVIRPGMSTNDLYDQRSFDQVFDSGLGDVVPARARCFLGIGKGTAPAQIYLPRSAGDLSTLLGRLFHLQGLRGILDRDYPVAAVGQWVHGLFEDYAASIIANWMETKDARLERLNTALQVLGLTWTVEAKRKTATSIEVQVGRTPVAPRAHARDLVNIADVGLGLSQSLPAVVALVAAEPGNLVYIEQPEIHLHPRAQVALAELTAESVNRGAQVVVETHSDLFLTALQRLVANGTLDPGRVRAHWFERDEDGATHIKSAGPDASGAFGDWPVDFADVAARVDMDYADAAFQRLQTRNR